MIRRNTAGFTLIELMIVVAIIASIAIPKLMSARLSANEAAAISTLRSISSSQAQIQSSAAIDCDADGAGEYGYFGELSGAFPMRISNGASPSLPAVGVAGTDELNPSVLASAFGTMTVGVVTRSGYCFQMWLPDAAGVGIPETATGNPAAPFPDPNNNEILWACYAWPMDVEGTGNRAFFINQEGDLLQCQNRLATAFSAAAAVAPLTTPVCGEVYVVPADMGSGLNIGVPTASGNTWTAVQ